MTAPNDFLCYDSYLMAAERVTGWSTNPSSPKVRKAGILWWSKNGRWYLRRIEPVGLLALWLFWLAVIACFSFLFFSPFFSLFYQYEGWNLNGARLLDQPWWVQAVCILVMLALTLPIA